jgi:hypothetical protein
MTTSQTNTHTHTTHAPTHPACVCMLFVHTQVPEAREASMSVTKDMLIGRGIADLSLRNRDIAKSWHNTRKAFANRTRNPLSSDDKNARDLPQGNRTDQRRV